MVTSFRLVASLHAGVFAFRSHCLIGVEIDGMIHNLSATGCGVESMCSYRSGEAVLLRFVLPTGEAIVLQAYIRWTGSGYFGAEFGSGQSEAQGRVCVYLESLPRPT